MNLSFGKISGANFQSFKKLELDFTKLKGTTTLIMGENLDDEYAASNGSGKSVILEAISWVLFGTTFRPLRYADEVIHLQENDCGVVMELFLDNKRLVVSRTKTKNKSAVLRIFDGEIELLKDSDTKAKQMQLEYILGFNFETFSNSVMFHLDYIAFPELKPAQRAEILTEIANLEVYVEASVLAKTKVSELLGKIGAINVEINTIKRLAESVRITLNDCDEKVTSWESDRITDLRNIRLEIIALKKEMSEKDKNLTGQIEAGELLIADLKKQSDEFQDKIAIFTENLDTEIDKNEKRVLQLTREETQAATEETGLRREVKKDTEEITFITKMKGGKCPTCQQEITEGHVDACVSELTKKITDTQSQITEKNALYERLRALKTQVNAELQKYKSRRTEANALKERLDQIVRATIKEEGLNNSRKEVLGNLKSRYDFMVKTKEESMVKLDESVNPYIGMKEVNTNLLTEKEKEISNLEMSLSVLEDRKKYFEFYIDGFKKIKLMLFDDLVNRLNELTQEYLSRYTSELSVRISCERQTKTGTKDELHIEIDRPEGPISYAAYSGGERQKIKLSVSLALAQVIEEMSDRACDFIFFDEPNGGLDFVGKRVNFDVFQDLANQGIGVIVIDHDAYFQDSFENVITVTKEDGYSRLALN